MPIHPSLQAKTKTNFINTLMAERTKVVANCKAQAKKRIESDAVEAMKAQVSVRPSAPAWSASFPTERLTNRQERWASVEQRLRSCSTHKSLFGLVLNTRPCPSTVHFVRTRSPGF